MALLNTLRFITRHPLNRGRRLKALKRFVEWQIGSRLVPGPVAVPFVGATRLLLKQGQSGGTGNWYTGLHDLPEMAFVLHAMRPGDLFVDVGANVGSYTVIAAGAVGCRCICFEPAQSAFETLLANVSVNNLNERVVARRAVVGAEEGDVSFTSSLDAMNHVASKDEQVATDLVAMTTLDRALEGTQPYCIKIDVEGFEAKVLQGGARTIRDPSLNILLMETGAGSRYSTSDVDLHHLVIERGFIACSYDPFDRRLEPLHERNTYGNTLYVRDVEEVKLRVKTAPRFDLANGASV
jgi:FkbM family methyltransferase